jgi:hypothetical protein
VKGADIMQKKYYIAYGSNLNMKQMKMRCPGAEVMGTAALKDWELLFKGSKTGSYLTIEPMAGSTVPVVVWKITPEDEKALDRYEGYPNFYYKKKFKVLCKSIETGVSKYVNAFAYIMHEDSAIGMPTRVYISTCLDGYKSFQFDKSTLIEAYKKSWEVCRNEK